MDDVLLFDEFRCFTRKGNEIHSSRQILDINLLVFSGNVALQQGLSHQVGDVVGWVW